ncbi:MAG: hemolysin, partial [Lachnospiraceae bacterium]|nr:hemolysin [Lachnospiraceae bacterium]
KYLVEGALSIDDFNEAVGTALSSDEYDSMGGIVIEHLDHMPEDGDEVTLDDGTVLKVVGMDQNRIVEVEITLPPEVLEEIAKKSETAEEADDQGLEGEEPDSDK